MKTFLSAKFTIAFIGIIWTFLAIPNIVSSFDGVILEYRNDPCTTMSISWESQATGVPFLSYLPFAESDVSATIVNAKIHRLSTNCGEKKLAVVGLEGLRAGTVYRYRLSDGNSWIVQGTFATAPRATSNFKFLVFGDSQCSRMNYSIWGRTLNQAYYRNSDAAFFVNVGDMIDNGADYGQWHEWLKNSVAVSSRLPFVPVLGNHEMRYSEGFSGKTLTESLLFDNSHKIIDKDIGAYSFDYAGIHLVILDTEALLDSKRQAVFEINWLENDLKQAEGKPSLVFMHRPVYNGKFFESAISGALVRQLQLLFEKYAVRAVFAGHVHQNSRTLPLIAGSVVKANGIVYFTCGRSGAKKYPAWLTAQSANNGYYYSPAAEPTYMTVEVAGKEIKVNTYTQQGKELDSTLL